MKQAALRITRCLENDFVTLRSCADLLNLKISNSFWRKRKLEKCPFCIINHRIHKKHLRYTLCRDSDNTFNATSTADIAEFKADL